MVCDSCGAEVHGGAKFCPDCGSPMAADPAAADTVVVDLEGGADDDAVPAPDPDLDPVAEPEPEPNPEPDPEPNPEPEPAPSARGPIKGAMTAERTEAASFVDAVLPILKAPIVTSTALATMLAVALTSIVATVVQALIELLADRETPNDLGDWWHFGWASHFHALQVPVVGHGDLFAFAPFVLIVIPITACWVAIRIARHVVAGDDVAGSSRVAPRTAIWSFAIAFAILNLILGAFGPDRAGVEWFSCLVISLGIAAGVAWWELRGRTAPAEPRRAAASWPARIAAALREPARVLAAMVLVASLIVLVANIVQTLSHDGDRRPLLVNHVVNSIDNGWQAVGYGMLGSARTDIDDRRSDEGDGDKGGHDGVRIWDLRDDNEVEGGSLEDGLAAGAIGNLDVAPYLLMLVAGFGTVLIGGLYAGFRMVRAAGRPFEMRDATITGALVGPAWAIFTIPLSWFVTNRFAFEGGGYAGDYSFTTMSGFEVFFLALLLGGVLGALGGMVAANAATRTTVDTAPPPTV